MITCKSWKEQWGDQLGLVTRALSFGPWLALWFIPSAHEKWPHNVGPRGSSVSCFYQLYSPSLTFTVGPQSARLSPEVHTLWELCRRQEPLFGAVGGSTETTIYQGPSLCRQGFWILTYTVPFSSHKNSPLLILQRKKVKG